MDTVSDGHRQKPQPQSTYPSPDLTTGSSLSLLSHGPSQHCSAAAPAHPLPLWSRPPACTDQLCSAVENQGQLSRQHVLVHPSNSRRYWECLYMPQVGVADWLQNLSWFWARAAEQGVNLG